MAEINDSTKKTTKSIMGGLLSLFRGEKKDSDILGKNATDAEVLGGIYKLMVQKEKLNVLEHERRKNYKEEEENEQARRHAEIIKALSIRRKKVPQKTKKEKSDSEKPGLPALPSLPKLPKTTAPKTTSTPPSTPAAPVKPPTTPTTPAAPAGPAAPATPAAPVKPPAATAAPTTPTAPATSAPTATPAPVTPKPPTTTATQAPSVTAPSATKIVTVAAGTGFVSSVAAKIAKGESRGSSKMSYTQANIVGKDVQQANIIKGNIDVTTGRPFEKSLTEMNIGEVIELGRRRYKHYNQKGGSALGKYQFIPGTLEETAKKVYGSLWKEKIYDEKTQEELNEGFILSNAERLKRANLPISDASLYMMHFFGNTVQTGLLLNANDSDSMEPILDYYHNIGKQKAKPSEQNKSVANMTVADYKKHLRSKGFDFQVVDGSKLQPIVRNGGDQTQQTSIENMDLRKSLASNQNTQKVTNNINQSTVTSSRAEDETVDDRPAYERKTK